MLIGITNLNICYNQLLDMVYFYFQQKFRIQPNQIDIMSIEFKSDGTVDLKIKGDMFSYGHEEGEH